MPSSRKTQRFTKKHLASCVFISLLSLPAAAQDSLTRSALERQVDEAFRQVFKAPADLDATLRYARLLVEAGNFEGGVAALERLLLTGNPHPSIRLELAVLYYRLESYQMAESLLREALDDGRLQDEQLNIARRLLIDTQARNQVSSLTGSVMFGMRRQSNPSARSSATDVYAGGVLTPLANAFRPKYDNDLNVTVRLDHRYDLHTQSEATVVTSLTMQYADYQSSQGRQLVANRTTPYDLGWMELTSGVSFKPMPVSLPGFKIRPYIILTELAAQGHRYLSNQGLGLAAEHRFDERTLGGINYEYRDYRYTTRLDVPNARDLDATDKHLRFHLSRELAANHLLRAEFGVRQHQTESSRYAYEGVDARLTYAVRYAAPATNTDYWTSTFWLGTTQRKYDAADPGVTALVSRKDTDWRVGTSLIVPVSAKWSVLAQYEQIKTDSNLPNFDSKNRLLMGAAIYSF